MEIKIIVVTPLPHCWKVCVMENDFSFFCFAFSLSRCFNSLLTTPLFSFRSRGTNLLQNNAAIQKVYFQTGIGGFLKTCLFHTWYGIEFLCDLYFYFFPTMFVLELKRCNFFPIQVRIIDCYLLEGPKVLYRVALAILLHYHKHVTVRGKGATFFIPAIACCNKKHLYLTAVWLPAHY